LSSELQARTSATVAPPPLTPARSVLLQRKCACGGSAGVSGQCSECQQEQLKLQRYSLDHAAPSSLLRSNDRENRATSPLTKPVVSTASAHSFGRVRVDSRAPHKVQARLAVSQPGDPLEQEADRAAEQVIGTLGHAATSQPQALSDTRPLVQRMPEQAEAPGAAATEAEAAPAGLIAEDDTGQLGPGQMRKSDFLDQLQSAVCSAADAQLAAVGRTAQGCPYIEGWIGYYRTRSGSHIERAIRRYAPGAASATAAHDYIPLVTQRVLSAVAVWAKTGEVTGIPEGMSPTPPAAGAGEAGQATGAASAGLQMKDAAGGAKTADDPAAISAQLGAGNSLDSTVRSRMESAFGYDFSRVRVHTDAKAAGLSAGLNARAFTVGSDVAFASGEYRPGTPVGDALIAHELAHVAQQRGATSAPMPKGGEYNGLEEDADRSAVGAVVSLWSGAKSGMADVAENAMPRLKSGLRLQRCDPPTKAKPGPRVPTLLQPEYVTGRVYRPCGEFIMLLNWFTNGRLGYIVQEITNTYECKDCSGAVDSSDGPTPHFYEAWEVDAKGTVTPNVVSPHGRVNDKWSRPARTEANQTPGSQGEWSITGKVYWAPILDPAASFKVGAVYDAHDLPSTTIRPNNLSKLYKEHRAAGKWDCCNGANDHDPM
jgi:hypothetical protein